MGRVDGMTIKKSVKMILGIAIVTSFFFIAAQPFSFAVSTTSQQYEPLATLMYAPKSHNFCNLLAGQINSTTFQIWKEGGCCNVDFEMRENCSWLTVQPMSGTTVSPEDKKTITVTVDTTGLSPGFYSYKIPITTNDCGSGTFTVYFAVVTNPTPSLMYSPASYDFGFKLKDHLYSTKIQIRNTGFGNLSYAVGSDTGWIIPATVSGYSHGENDTINVTINTNGFENKVYSGNVTIQSNNGSGTIPLSVTIVENIGDIEIGTIAGGFGVVSAYIRNVGEEAAHNITWNISVNGGLRGKIHVLTEGLIVVLPKDGTTLVTTDKFLFGLGPIEISVNAMFADSKTKQGSLFLFFVST
jgi:hypothetical protein